MKRIPELTLFDAPPDAFESYVRVLEIVKPFLAAAFPGIPEPLLEDVFTLLDQTIGKREYCSGFSWEELEKAREAFKRAILFVIHAAGQEVRSEAQDLYNRIAGHLIDLRATHGQRSDPFSVISLNWDCLLEDSFYRCIRKARLQGVVDVDYCCYTDPLGPECPHTPSLVQRAKGLYNLKVLKLHGSTNWLRCPNCNRLFTGVGSDLTVWGQYVNPQRCSVCPGWPGGHAPELEPFFITPTFVKVFDNAHIQTIWHNAYVELTEATRVVFLGYSLPLADYHVRTLLRRSIQPGAEIVAVLAPSDTPIRNTPRRLRWVFAASRFRAFFGNERIQVETDGIEKHFDGILGDEILSRMMRRTCARIRRNAGKV